jgi:hypothetical protein
MKNAEMEKKNVEAEEAEKRKAEVEQADKKKAEEDENKRKVEAKVAEIKRKASAEEAENKKVDAEKKKEEEVEDKGKAEAEEGEFKRKAAAEEAEKNKADAEKKKAEEAENKRKAEAEEAEIKRKAAAEEAVKKKADAEKKVEAEEKRIQVAIQKQLKDNIKALKNSVPAAKLKKMFQLQMSKEYAQQRQQYKDRLNMLRQEAKAEIDSLEKSIDGQAGPSSSVDDIQFPAESDDDINNLTQPIRLSQDEVSVGQADFSEFQRMIFKRLGDRVLKKPREYISPFKIPRNQPEIPLAKVVALRRKIASDPELKRFFFVFPSCNCYLLFILQFEPSSNHFS